MSGTLPPTPSSRVRLRAPAASDAAAFTALRQASRAELEPFEAFPENGPDPFSPQEPLGFPGGRVLVQTRTWRSGFGTGWPLQSAVWSPARPRGRQAGESIPS